MSDVKQFSASAFPLTGHRLIEASAGTGKTYNIANLYLRLLVGDSCTPKTVDQILVVTFTRAATNELRGRIREKVEQALHAFRASPGAECQDGFIQSLLERTHDEQKRAAARLLNNALLRMDEACIFTIHGFAVRAIQTFLFETGALANVEISEAGNARKVLLLADLWRQFQMTPHASLRACVATMGFQNSSQFSQYFFKKIDQVDIAPAFTITQPVSALIDYLPALDKATDKLRDALLQQRDVLRKQWLEIQKTSPLEDWIAALRAVDLPAAKRLTDPGPAVVGYIEACLSVTELKPKNFMKGSNQTVDRLRVFMQENPVHPYTQYIERLLAHIEQSQSENDIRRSAFRALLLQYINARMAEIELSSMQLDEVISLISNILRQEDDKARQLRAVITGAYPVCMVDEFQDTDPAQFEMFNLLYGDNPQAGFFMIGDPKQSIYQFRGADIFSYLAVRKTVKQLEESSGDQHVFTLDTNFRSKSALVAATNALFRDGDLPSFLYPGIDYVSVHSCEDQFVAANKGDFTVGDKKLSSAPLVIVGNDAEVDGEEKFNGDTLRWKYAKDTAQRIALLINREKGGLIKKPGKAGLPVAGGDIAVLVRTGREAAIVREALLAQVPPVGSVYQSQNDSVFKSSFIAEDIYHLLCAMDEPGNKNLLKKAMVTLFYRGYALDFQALDAMNTDDSADDFFEQSIAEFSEYRRYWDDYGVLSAINHLVRQRGLMQKLAALPDCDRLVTDLRHLGELLQARSQACSSREQLILWFGRQLKDDSELEENSKRIRLESDDNLVKIVTIHVSKGLEYPIVFLPFFFMPWLADASSNLPLYHPEPDYQPRVDFSAESSVINTIMQKEMLAEDMRLLYVAMTRAIYQCYVGISPATHFRTTLFPLTCWAHLLGMQNVAMPAWPEIAAALKKRLGIDNRAIDYRVLFDAKAGKQGNKKLAAGGVRQQGRVVLQSAIEMPALSTSHWVITSYSALAHARKEPGQQRGGYDELLLPLAEMVDADFVVETDDKPWADNIRYRLPGGTRTGDCLHMFFEALAKTPDKLMELRAGEGGLLHDCLRRHGLEKPDGNHAALLPETRQQLACAEWRQEIAVWLDAVLDTVLSTGHATPLAAGELSLRQVFLQQAALPELAFDLALGTKHPVQILDGINVALRQSGLDGITVPRRSELEGILTGSMDLLFIHDKKVYVLDYKSNTLGKAPRFYDRQTMDTAMKEHRYNLQYLIYSVAAHRYMRQRLGTRYDFDDGDYSFGGVFYLFLRGMGLPDYPGQGVFFERPARRDIEALDAAFAGEEIVYG